MRAYDIIYKKREGQKLTKEELEFLINGYVNEDIADYQMSAWAMAVYFQGMDAEETANLTMLMAESGDMIDLSDIKGFKVDKHSTGGVGDTTTLVLAPLVAAAGLPVAKMSGRGLGHTGGTIDKLESIPGFNVNLSREEFIKTVNDKGIAVVGQTGNLTPADKKLYSLRDVTATVDSIPLIASSIMSKKIAGGADGIVLDVKLGSGAFMKDIKEAEKLAEIMVNIGEKLNKKTIAVLTDMEQPLGKAVGNNLEVIEAVNTLKDQGPLDLREICLTLGANMLLIAEKVNSFKKGYKLLEDKLKTGEAFDKFKEIVEKQGGDLSYIENTDKFKKSQNRWELKSQKNGYLVQLKAINIGLTAMLVGAGRTTKSDEILNEVGVILHKKYGNRISKGDKIATLHYNKKDDNFTEAVQKLKDSYLIENKAIKPKDLIYKIIK